MSMTVDKNSGEKMKKILSTLVMAGILMFGCASKNTVKDAAQPEQRTVKQEQIKDKLADKKVSQETVSSKGTKTNADIDSLRLIKEMQARMKDIHFDYDRYGIRNDEKPILRAVADTLKKNNGVKVTIEGNCDDRGTNEYNLALGDRRANAARDFLLSLGVSASRMETVSYGEEKPVCTEDNESCWAKNRRDHFVLN